MRRSCPPDAGAESPAIVVFARVDDLVADQPTYAGRFPRRAVATLASWGVRLVLVSGSTATYVRRVQHQLKIAEPFVCDGGAAVHVPDAYFLKPDASVIAAGDWEIFRLNPPNRTAAVNLLRDLFMAGGCHDVLTIGIGCDLDDYGVLTAVDVPVVVRDPMKEQRELLRHVPGAYLTNATGIAGWSEALIGPF